MSASQCFRVGANAIETACACAAMLPGSAELELVTYSPGSNGRDRSPRLLASPFELLLWTHGQADSRTALEAAAQWFGCGPATVVGELLRHSDTRLGSNQIHVPRDAFTPARMEEFADSLAPEQSLGLSSRVLLANGVTVHFPLMDYACPPDDFHLTAIAAAMPRLGQHPWAVLQSGRSYHSYHSTLLSMEEWGTFMARALLLAPLTDTRYIAHRLLEGRSVLRIASNKGKPHTPRVVLTDGSSLARG